jgi:hypothetical protein
MRKKNWDACVAEINEDPTDLKKNFDIQMLGVADTIG